MTFLISLLRFLRPFYTPDSPLDISNLGRCDFDFFKRYWWGLKGPCHYLYPYHYRGGGRGST